MQKKFPALSALCLKWTRIYHLMWVNIFWFPLIIIMEVLKTFPRLINGVTLSPIILKDWQAHSGSWFLGHINIIVLCIVFRQWSTYFRLLYRQEINGLCRKDVLRNINFRLIYQGVSMFEVALPLPSRWSNQLALLLPQCCISITGSSQYIRR